MLFNITFNVVTLFISMGSFSEKASVNVNVIFDIPYIIYSLKSEHFDKNKNK